MRKAKKLSNKLMAVLLSASMIFAPVIQSMPVYAAEPVIEAGSADTLTDNAAMDEPAADNDSDAPAADNGESDNQGIENGDFNNSGTENGDSNNSGTENGDSGNSGTENGDSDNSGTENGDSENSGTENGDSENPGTENGDSDAPPETEDGDTENPEDPDAEDGDSEDLGDAEDDESLSEDELTDGAFMAVGVKAATVRGQNSVNVSDFSNVGGWNESIYAEIAGVKPEDVVDVEYSGAASGKLSTQKGNVDGETALDYLVRKDGSGVRIDVPGLKAGNYTLTVTLGSNKKVLKEENITVYAYDRSGYAHFKYTDGVGAYKDDGTLKDNAVVLYVNDENKNTVTLKVGNTTVSGIGNILNSVGKDCGEAGHAGECKRVSGKKTYYGKANDNQGIITKLSEANIPLVVRFIGAVSDSGLNGQSGTFSAASTPKIDGLTIYDSYDNGGSPGDNGHMARIQSGKNITLEGIGYDAAIDGWGFHFMAETSTTSKGFGKGFEVRNLKFVNTPEDAIGMEGQQSGSEITAGVERCWVHNNEFYCPHITSPAESDKSEGDGSVDFKRGQYFTCSYNYFDSCHKTNLVGSADTSLQYNLTYHHNYWYMCKARGPLTRQANVHMYNNIFDMQTDYAMNTRANAYIFSESNLFYACKSPQAVEAGAIKSWHDSITSVLWNKGSAGTVVSSRDEEVKSSCAYNGTSYSSFENDSNLFYKDGYYLQDNDFETMRKVIVSQTGLQKQNPKRPEDVTTSDYSVITRMSGGKEAEQIDISDGAVTKNPGKISKTVYVFEVGAAFDLEVGYATGDKAIPGVLVNEEGENLLDGDGKVLNLPAGKYMIQALTFQPGDPAKKTIAVFKDFTIESLKISAADPNAHVHKWVLDSTKDAGCTEAGEKVYKCKGTGTCDAETPGEKKEPIPALGHNYALVAGSGTAATCTEKGTGTFKCSRCSDEYTGEVPALGHKWGNWTTVTPATETTEGEEQRVCANDPSHVETQKIPAGGSGTVNPTPGPGVVTPAGDYELYFTGKKVLGDTDFFTVASGGGFSDSKGTVTVNGTEYKYSLKMASSTVTFSCNDGATLFMAFVSDNANDTVMVGSTEYTIGSDGTLTIENMQAGTYTIAKGSTKNEKDLNYVSVSNGATKETYRTLSFEYNYDDSPDAKTVSVLDGTSYETESDLVPAGFKRSGYTLKGLYTDAFCTTAVTYPYTVSGNATLYADWTEDDDNGLIEKTYSLIFDSKGGTTFARVKVTEGEIYKITQIPTREGYAFAGWYDAETGGNRVEVVDGAELAGLAPNGQYNLYARWNEMGTSLSLDCATDLKDYGTANTADGGRDITELTPINGFKIHASSDKDGTTKLYMTIKSNSANGTDKELLFTNGMLLDKNSTYNADGLLKTIEFTTEGAGVLTVSVAGSGNFTPDKKPKRNCHIAIGKLVNGVLTEIEEREITSEKVSDKDFDIDAAGTYYLYAKKVDDNSMGVVYASINFTQPKYTILYQTNGGTAEGIDNIESKAAGDKITLPTACVKDGYEFVGWLIGDSATPVGKDSAFEYTVSADDESNGVITITAKYTAKKYTIKYALGGGSMDNSADLEVEAGTPVSLGTPISNDEDKIFAGWTIGEGDSKRTLAGKTYTVRAGDAVNGTITLTAEYKDRPVVYTIKFDANGGSLPSDLQGDKLLETGAKIDLSPYKPTSEGQRFVGWQIKDGELLGAEYTVKAADADENKTITIKAVYKTEYTVNFVSGEGELPTGMTSGNKYIEGESVTLGECTLADTSNNKFDGWYINDPDALMKTSYTVNPADADAETKTITLTAKYVSKDAKKYTVTLELDGGKLVGGEDKTSLEYTEGSKFDEKAEKEGYKFIGWTLNGEKIETPYPITEDVTLKAEYKKDQEQPVVYTIKFDGNGGSLPSDLQSDKLLEAGAKIDLSSYQPTSEGQRFVGWQIKDVELKGAEYTVKAADADADKTITIKAVYKTEYTVNFVSGEGTPPSGMTSGNKYIEGESVTLGECTLAEESNNRFDGWYIKDSETLIKASSYIVDPADADSDTKTITITAKYVPKDAKTFTVTLDLDGGTLDDGTSPDSLKYTEGSKFDETAKKDGYTFIGWTLNGEKINTPYLVEADITLKAAYEEISYGIVYQAENGTLPTGLTTSAKAGDTIKIPDATPAEGYKFKGWSVDGGETTFKDSYTVKAEDARNGVIMITAVCVPESDYHDGIAIIGLEESYEYTGAKITPNIGVVDYNYNDGEGKVLAPGVDYTVKYKNNKGDITKEETIAEITIAGKGNYAGKWEKKTKFKITKPKLPEGSSVTLEDLKGAKIDKIDPIPYAGGAEIRPAEIKLKLKGKDFVTYTYDADTDAYKTSGETPTYIPAIVTISNNVNKGTATILLTGKNGTNNKATTVKKTFKITPIDLADAKVKNKLEVTQTSGTYAVKGAAPASITVKYDGNPLRNGTDYTVKYSNNKKATTGATAKLVITGKGNYAKKVDYMYAIDKLDMSKITVKAVTAYEGIKAGKVKATVVDNAGNPLKPAQYELKLYKANEGDSTYGPRDELKKTDTLYVSAVAKDTTNLDGATARAEFAIGLNIAKAKVVLKKDSKTGKTITKEYTGGEVKLTSKDIDKVTLKVDGLDKPLVYETDYEIVSYSNNINKGNATAVIKGKGSYSGTKTVKFKIVGKNININTEERPSWDDVSGLIKSFMNGLSN